MSRIVDTPHGRLRRTGGRESGWLLEVPGCDHYELLSEEQLHGRLSVNHAATGCSNGYHETHDFAAELRGARQRLRGGER